ncbi:MAG: tryptophan synthase subunit alpha [Dissulfurimicrobium sp.]|uniref:tryptophan synthase subunit alpha n=1 Tax=Dissulfurimicrobium sp. TaxID=2022436 RepID=UPI00404AD82E
MNKTPVSKTNRIDEAFSRLKKTNGAALIPFITAGDPDLTTTKALIFELVKNGADIIELGLPFSDPLADGPTIQAASQRALVNNVNAHDLFGIVRDVRRKTDVPLVLMGYYNSILQYGLMEFAREAVSAGLDGVIVPDLPLEEAAVPMGWMDAARANGLANIMLVAPTTPPARAKRIAGATDGFLYYVSVTGITGARAELPSDLHDGLMTVKGLTKRPVAVGFGISRPEQVAMLSKIADGIIVGSAIVKIIEANIIRNGGGFSAGPNLVEAVGKFVKALKEAASSKK